MLKRNKMNWISQVRRVGCHQHNNYINNIKKMFVNVNRRRIITVPSGASHFTSDCQQDRRWLYFRKCQYGLMYPNKNIKTNISLSPNKRPSGYSTIRRIFALLKHNTTLVFPFINVLINSLFLSDIQIQGLILDCSVTPCPLHFLFPWI